MQHCSTVTVRKCYKSKHQSCQFIRPDQHINLRLLICYSFLNQRQKSTILTVVKTSDFYSCLKPKTLSLSFLSPSPPKKVPIHLSALLYFFLTHYAVLPQNITWKFKDSSQWKRLGTALQNWLSEKKPLKVASHMQLLIKF